MLQSYLSPPGLSLFLSVSFIILFFSPWVFFFFYLILCSLFIFAALCLHLYLLSVLHRHITVETTPVFNSDSHQPRTLQWCSSSSSPSSSAALRDNDPPLPRIPPLLTRWCRGCWCLPGWCSRSPRWTAWRSRAGRRRCRSSPAWPTHELPASASWWCSRPGRCPRRRWAR